MNKLINILCAMVLAGSAAQAQVITENPQVTIHTSKGDIRLELFADKAPETVDNFLHYSRDAFYDGTIFHRVISHFMIQGGGMTADLKRKSTREPIHNEATNGLSNVRGTISMARTTDQHSATAQFFINVEINKNLDHMGTTNSRAWGYAVFGKVISGLEVVDEIRFVKTNARDIPLEPVTINSVEIH